MCTSTACSLDQIQLSEVAIHTVYTQRPQTQSVALVYVMGERSMHHGSSS